MGWLATPSILARYNETLPQLATVYFTPANRRNCLCQLPLPSTMEFLAESRPIRRTESSWFFPCATTIHYTNGSSRDTLSSQWSHVRLVKIHTESDACTPPEPCRVISGDERAMSAPLRSYTYDYRQRAYCNNKGYTWTPAYSRYSLPPGNKERYSPERRINDKDFSFLNVNKVTMGVRRKKMSCKISLENLPEQSAISRSKSMHIRSTRHRI